MSYILDPENVKIRKIFQCDIWKNVVYDIKIKYKSDTVSYSCVIWKLEKC